MKYKKKISTLMIIILMAHILGFGASAGTVKSCKTVQSDLETKSANGTSYSTSETERVDESKSIIHSPEVSYAGVCTWDCIWFGNYWQEDTNGDGHCFSEDIEVEVVDDYGQAFDQHGRNIGHYPGFEEGLYRADKKQPIKWRILSVDSEYNALLVSDQCLEARAYHDENDRSITWEHSTLRSFLNGYGENANKCGEDFTESGFLYSAFSAAEQDAIQSSKVVNDESDGSDEEEVEEGTEESDDTVVSVDGFIMHTKPSYGADASTEEEKDPYVGKNFGNDTEDKLFCLSASEIKTVSYGFLGDDSRKANYTRYIEDKKKQIDDDNYSLQTLKKKQIDDENYWLRTPDTKKYVTHATVVKYDGSVHSDLIDFCKMIRPAFRMNLKSSESLWTYAGKVSSDGSVLINQRISSLEMSNKELSFRPGEKWHLKVEITPENTVYRALVWTSDNENVAVVDNEGNVTTKAEGSATITCSTEDEVLKTDCSIVVRDYKGIRNPIMINGKTEWDTVYFGRYWQDMDSNRDEIVTRDDIKTPIRWRVLNVDEDGTAFLLSDKALFSYKYGEVQCENWAESTLRSYLNGYGALENLEGINFSKSCFLNDAFIPAEREAILDSHVINKPPYWLGSDEITTRDKVFCLSFDEITNEDYGFKSGELVFCDEMSFDMEISGTDFKMTKYAEETNRASVVCWLRNGNLAISSGGFAEYDSIYGWNLSGKYLIRPAIKLNLSACPNLWTYAGTVYSDGTENEVK